MIPPMVKAFFYRGFLPFTLFFAAFLRPCFLSIGYVILALISPILPSIQPLLPLPGSIRLYEWGTLLYCLLVGSGQLGYQIYETVTRPNEKDYALQCNSTELKWWRYMGFIRFHGGDGFESSRSILPEILSVFIALLSTIIVTVLPHRSEELDIVGSVQAVRTHDSRNTAGHYGPIDPISSAIKRFSNFAIIIISAIVGCVQPSILNFAYLFAFLFVASWWSLYKPLRHGAYNTIKKALILYAALHILLIYIYQIQVVQIWIPGNELCARILGLSPILHTDCSSWWSFWFNHSLEWPALINPAVLLIFYHMLVVQMVWTLDGSRNYTGDDDQGSSVHEELLANDENDGDSGPSIPLRKVTSEVVNKHKISQLLKASGQNETATAQGVVAIISFIIHHAYAFSLLTMMAWALLYHSIFGLILLVLTCVLWMFKDTRSAAFTVAPILQIYIEILLLIQYLCSMNLSAEDIYIEDWIKMLGVILASSMVNGFVTLTVKLLLSLPVFALLRLSLREKFYNSLSEHERSQRLQSYGTFSDATKRLPADISSSYEPNRRRQTIEYPATVAVRLLSHQVAKYWIVFVAFVLLFVACQPHPVLYTIGFFCIWSFLILYFKISFHFFRNIAYVFWLSLIVYTSLVIISLYVYQFPDFPDVWSRWTKLDREWNNDIGLINYSNVGESGTLFLRLLTPISLFVVTMLQLKFFHEPWSDMVQPVRVETELEGAPGPSTVETTLSAKICGIVNELVEIIWRITEEHISKIVFIIVTIFAAQHICALFLPLVILVSLALCLPTGASSILSIFMCAYLCLVALMKMVYQLSHFPNLSVSGGELCNATQTFPEWLGIEKNANTWNLLSGMVVSIIALATQSVVVYRQRYIRLLRGEQEERKDRVFPTFSINQFDESIVQGFKFIIDYGFYKFGLECCIIMMGINAWVRMDLLGVVMCIWLAIFALNKRYVSRKLWYIFVLYLAILLPLQYMVYIGLPEDSCLEYPWDHFFGGSSRATKNVNFDIWMGLANYAVRWPAENLIADFFMLLLASCQLKIFRKEGEDNDSIFVDKQYCLKPNNPRYDFIDTQRSFVDFIKIGIFHYGHWVTLIMTLIAGIGGTSLFALGYIVITFWILWQGNNLYVMNATTNSFKSTLAKWNTLMAYTVFTMFCKVALQLVGCVFLEWFSVSSSVRCPLRQIFSITCVNSVMNSRAEAPPLFPTALDLERSCPVDQKEAQIGFDVLALGFLIFQMRIFHSWFFQHCMVEYRSEVILANRGAVLKNQLIEKEMKEQNEQQMEKFDEIRNRTQAIRDRYNKQLEKGTGIFEPQTYGQAKRTGDYYMFDYDPNSDELIQPVESFVPEVTPGATEFDKLDPGQLVYAATSKDLDLARTMERVIEAEKIKDSEERMIEAVREDVYPAKTNLSHTPSSTVERPSSAHLTNNDSKAVTFLKFIKKLTVNGMDMISAFLNKMSREHRYVAFVLNKEKEKLKTKHSESLSDTSRKLTDLRNGMDLTSLHMVHSERDIDKMERAALNDWQQRSVVARFINAVLNCIGANTDLLCYLLAVVAHAAGAGLITLPLPLMVFLWGTLSNPRPSKFFWVAMIAYTECVIVVKFICQFTFFDFNKVGEQSKNSVIPMTIDKIFGIQRQTNFAAYDVPLLFALFFHRYMLRKFGLWKDANLTVTFQNIQEEDTNGIPALSTVENLSRQTIQATQDEYKEEKNGSNTQQKNPIVRFIEQLFKPKFRYIRDLYPIMFGLDVICFLIIAFGYSGFGEGGSGNVIGDIQKSRIPLTLVVMLIVMTLMIVIDRGLYLRKWVYGKVAYQLVIIIFIHIWIFFVLPQITRRTAAENTVAQALYVVKCVYMLVSAWQIRNGYPQLCIGNLLTHAYGLANMVFFKVFMAVPFLFELRTAIDWTWTDTSMPLFDFFNMENFYAVIYNLKCARTFEQSYPAPRGVPKGVIVKYLMGLPMILLIVLLVWSPLLAFSLMNQIGDISIPDRVKLTMSLEGYPPLYQIEAQGSELRPMTSEELKKLTNWMSVRFQPNSTDSIKRLRTSVSYLKDYTPDDMLVVDFRPESEVFWPISSESMDALVAQLKGNSSIKFQVSVEFTRPYDSKKKEAAKHSAQWNLDVLPHTVEREKWIAVLKGGEQEIELAQAFPSYMLVPNEGEVSVPDPIVTSILENQDEYQLPGNATRKEWFDSITLRLTDSTAGERVWVVQAKHPTQFTNVYFDAPNVTYGRERSLSYVQTVAFVDKAFPSFFAKYLQGGVIAMYISLVIVVGRLIRGVFTNAPTDVMITEIPNPDFLLKICLDIYLVREAKDFILEQDLFAKLIFLFRSPATLIQWTRYKVKDD